MQSFKDFYVRKFMDKLKDEVRIFFYEVKISWMLKINNEYFFIRRSEHSTENNKYWRLSVAWSIITHLPTEILK